MIELQRFSIQYPHKTISYPDISVRRGEAVGLFGRSGCGKTSLLTALCEPDPPGALRYQKAELLGQDLRRWGTDRWTRMSYVPQYAQNALNPKLTVGEHFRLVLAGNGKKGGDGAILKLFEQLQLEPELLTRYPGALSGGQKQRIILALGVIKEPELLLLDEPSSALDLITLQEIVEFLLGIKQKTTLVMVAHQRALLEKVMDRIVEL